MKLFDDKAKLLHVDELIVERSTLRLCPNAAGIPNEKIVYLRSSKNESGYEMRCHSLDVYFSEHKNFVYLPVEFEIQRERDGKPFIGELGWKPFFIRKKRTQFVQRIYVVDPQILDCVRRRCYYRYYKEINKAKDFEFIIRDIAQHARNILWQEARALYAYGVYCNVFSKPIKRRKKCFAALLAYLCEKGVPFEYLSRQLKDKVERLQASGLEEEMTVMSL
ncbi:MAG: hypothetical protein QXP01_01245 [Candidatus Hadarchaeum sp.]